MKVELWHKVVKQTGATSRHTQGLIVNGERYSWREVTSKWGLNQSQFLKRRDTNCHWTMEELLTTPMKSGKKKQYDRHGRGYRNSWQHTPEQLEANRIARMKW